MSPVVEHHSSAAVGAHPPGPRRRVPALSALEMGRDPLAFLLALRDRYGDIARVPLGGETLYLFSHPDLVRDVLVTNHRNFHKGRGLERAKRLLGTGLLTSEGEFHLRQRRLSQPERKFPKCGDAPRPGFPTKLRTVRDPLAHATPAH